VLLVIGFVSCLMVGCYGFASEMYWWVWLSWLSRFELVYS